LPIKARKHNPISLHPLRTIPGIDQVLAFVILYEIHDIHRFPKVGRSVYSMLKRKEPFDINKFFDTK